MTQIMNQRYRIYRRQRGLFYLFDRSTGKRESLNTTDKDTAVRVLQARNEAQRQPIINLQIARAYLAVGDPEVAKRTWQTVMDEMVKLKRSANQHRWRTAIKDPSFDKLRHRPILETNAELFLHALETGTISTNVFLRRLHNFALGMNWLPWPVVPKKQWPPVQYGVKRAITLAEHQAIVARERNPERRAFYRLAWHLGASQTDLALLEAGNIDWPNQIISYARKKTGELAFVRFAEEVAVILRALPSSGPLFPYLRRVRESDRATEFKQRCRGLGISGVTLHSYRYAWAERAKTVGYPERFAQEALGHNSKAVHRAYARNAKVVVPSLESFENGSAHAQNGIALSSQSVCVQPSANVTGVMTQSLTLVDRVAGNAVNRVDWETNRRCPRATFG